jgi:hypothetical protein
VHDPDSAGARIENREDGRARSSELKTQALAKDGRLSTAAKLAAMLCVALTVAACMSSSQRQLKRQLQLFRAYSIDSVLVAPTETVVDSSIPPGEVDGIVVGAYSGEPIVSAAVFLQARDHSSRPIFAITDPYGHFVLKAPPREYTVVESRILGYVRDTVTLGGKFGHFVRFGLRRQKLILCTSFVASASPATYDSARAISVFVRDSRTNAPPNAPVTLRVRDGSFTESVTLRAPDVRLNDSLVIRAGAERPGVYDVEVAAPGYATWRLYDMPIAQDCQGLHGRTFPVWLLPVR